MRATMRFAAIILVVLGITMMIGCFGMVAPPDHDFLERFPAGRKICNRNRAQIIRACYFDTAAATGKLKVTFADAEDKFDVPGSFTFTNMKADRSPTATLTIVYGATDKLKGRYRKLVARQTSKAGPAEREIRPAELPDTQEFSVKRGSKPGSPMETFELTDKAGILIKLDPSQTFNGKGEPIECD
jgi:hypothetical protein